MAAPMDIEIIPNEFYELEIIPETMHPHPPLRDFKIVMVAEITVDRAVVFKWPSFRSLAFFVKDRLHVLPTLDQECTLMQFHAARLLKRRIDSVQLCFYDAWTREAWLHDHAMNPLRAAMGMITDEHTEHTQNTRIRLDHFYAFSCTELPRDVAVAGFPRIAWVSRVIESPNDEHPAVEVRLPSMASLYEFWSSESLILPEFNQFFSTDSYSARLFLKRILPMQLCFLLRNRRDFWINENQERIHNNLDAAADVHGAGAGADVHGAGAGAGAGNDAHDD